MLSQYGFKGDSSILDVMVWKASTFSFRVKLFEHCCEVQSRSNHVFVLQSEGDELQILAEAAERLTDLDKVQCTCKEQHLFMIRLHFYYMIGVGQCKQISDQLEQCFYVLSTFALDLSNEDFYCPLMILVKSASVLLRLSYLTMIVNTARLFHWYPLENPNVCLE